MQLGLGRLLLSLSVIIILHASFSTYEHLSQLKALDRPQYHALPRDIVIESLIALLIGILGAVLKTPELKVITWSSEMKNRSIDEIDSRLTFARFNHKGRRIFGIEHRTGS